MISNAKHRWLAVAAVSVVCMIVLVLVLRRRTISLGNVEDVIRAYGNPAARVDRANFSQRQVGRSSVLEFHIIGPSPFELGSDTLPATFLFCSRPYLVGYLEESWSGRLLSPTRSMSE